MDRWRWNGKIQCEYLRWNAERKSALLGGAARAIECFHQLRGEAGERQVKGVKKALAHGTYGAAGQHQAVVIMEKGR